MLGEENQSKLGLKFFFEDVVLSFMKHGSEVLASKKSGMQGPQIHAP